MKRRDVLALLGAAAAWPLAASAQPRTVPVIGYLSGLSAGDRPHLTDAFRQGLGEAGFAEGRDFTIEYRYADNRMDRLQSLAADLVNRKVAVIAAVGGNNTALAARRLTSTIPILFTSGLDPVTAGLVASLNRPEANVTGVSWFSTELGRKHVELLHELVPGARLIASLRNPNNPEAEFYQQSAQEGVRALGTRLLVLEAGTVRDIDAAFAMLAAHRADAVLIGSDPFFPARARQLAVLAARYGVPMIGGAREVSLAGGLITYGNSVSDAYRRVGVYAGRILKGTKPADLPVDRSIRFELVVNLGTARALGLDIPPTLLARADEVIE
jgi:putative ABC transport system substrate-binding protein